MYEPHASPEAGSRPLPSFQRRIWLVHERTPGSPALNSCRSYRLSGPLDVGALRSAVAEVTRRHEILRTTYDIGPGGSPVAFSHRERPPFFAEIDVSGMSPQSCERRLEVLVRREWGHIFALSSEPLLRTSVFHLADDEHVVVFVAHRICWDEDSWGVFFTELNRLMAGEEPPLLGSQYLELARAADAERSERFSAELAYWRDKLRHPPEPVEIPGERLTAAPNAAPEGWHTSEIPEELVRRVRDFCRQEDCEPFVVFLAAFAAVLWRHARADDFLIAVPARTRALPAQRQAIGNFGSVLPLRHRVSSCDTFRSLVARTKECCAGAFAHQGLDLGDIVQALRLSEDADRTPPETEDLERLVRVGFAMREAAAELADARPVGSCGPAAGFPLVLTVRLLRDGAVAELRHAAEVARPSMAENLMRSYILLLAQVLDGSDRPLAQIELLDQKDKERMLGWSTGERVDRAPATLSSLVEQQVARTPDSVALVSGELQLTYRQMNERANRLAHCLIGRGLGPGDIVAIVIANSVEFLIAMLGVLKAGCAYLPVDPEYPAERAARMTRTVEPKLVIDLARLAELENTAHAHPSSDPTDADRVRPLRPANLAYVIHTSGSTGEPKGVAVPHDAIADYIGTIRAMHWMGHEDRALLVTSVSFDASLFDIFGTLSSGARLIVPNGRGADFAEIEHLMGKHQVTMLHVVPSMLNILLSVPGKGQWKSLRKVPVGGEALSGELADRFASVIDAALENFYGPTEAVLAATRFAVPKLHGPGAVPVGAPLPNNVVYVLDDSLELVPPGVVGEVYLGGNQLAQGYWGNPGLTAERFVADPFSSSGRLYRTGDLARWDDSGVLEFLGRRDEQVKVSGFRIELGEVASAVSAHPLVEHSVVVATALPGLGRSLVAYLVPASQRVDVAQIRAQVATVLPKHMVPAVFMVVDKIPVTAHGKLDRKALPQPKIAPASRFREAETLTEKRLCAIFCGLLERSRVGVDDSFFDFGGHSLLATRLVAQIQAEFGVVLDARSPFEAPSVARLAELVDQARKTAPERALGVGSQR
ncbi:amino acid adenylation domain protein [Segniliparus rotundus DSM 44985]|uniref:Amino acid adenylation domain protein n=1 Tax=Segniliparus rotundus (strain ATCC BAA-972 / CDC 1076 / CIP 108378 / DSM 44985 / JCM 13578) TaxID=640132 RepID=D6ZFQ6_SEGRD|nr:non-ribosomal peptide synthetase [Segniliparus rotundus]ADG97780.1 amino acid adenylation domain protein [Segniliparus rotundus DSM 44985]